MNSGNSIPLDTVENYTKDTSCITGKRSPNSILISTCASFTTVAIILSFPHIFQIQWVCSPQAECTENDNTV